MPLPHDPGLEDQQLVRYLLGLLSEKDTERLDEMSIADDEVASRLAVAEDDLVDAYVSGALSGETLDRFESFYLSSPRRREKVRLARTFRRAVDRDRNTPISRGSPSPERTGPRSKLSWKLAAVAALVLVVSGSLLLQQTRLRSRLDDARIESATLDGRARQLEKQLADERTANRAAVQELDRIRAAAESLTTTALVLIPQTRAMGPIATLAVPEGVDHVTLELRLEANDFMGYQVALKDPATNGVVWRSSQIRPLSRPDGPIVPIAVPANVLKPQHYSFELMGLRAAGRAEVVGSYALQIVRR